MEQGSFFLFSHRPVSTFKLAFSFSFPFVEGPLPFCPARRARLRSNQTGDDPKSFPTGTHTLKLNRHPLHFRTQPAGFDSTSFQIGGTAFPLPQERSCFHFGDRGDASDLFHQGRGFPGRAGRGFLLGRYHRYRFLPFMNDRSTLLNTLYRPVNGSNRDHSRRVSGDHTVLTRPCLIPKNRTVPEKTGRGEE